ncbi:PAS domain-containing sensor histidine kinase [Thalassobacillus pellis]|uniref:PAS domain-containing sensor histidine kinase n=1 Tax=Thalassobacillus pellis TaxID=748008 RepID=UPI001EF8F5F0|nr:PAS domain-containing protein [Thalassobacillus pellis]MBM7554194.1 PAS domain S-box-containing protein [Thalassobacillus pellis]
MSVRNYNNHHSTVRTLDEATFVVNGEGFIQSANEAAKELFDINEKPALHIQNILPDIDLSVLEQGTVVQHFGVGEAERTFPVFLRKNTFELHGKQYDLLTVNRNNATSSISGLDPQQVMNELLDMKFALDESTILAITDQRGKIKYVNDKFCDISKYSKDELIGQDHRIINSGYHDKAFMRHLWRTIANGKVWRGEIKNKAKDGTYYWVDTTIVPFLDNKGRPYQYLAIRKEITEFKRVVDELEQSMQELVDLKFALDESSIVAITDNRGVITYVNDRFCQVSKYTKEELIGRDHSLINSGYHPKSFFKDLWRTIGSGKVWKGEIKNKAKDGTYYWVDTTIVPFLNDNGKPYQYLAIRSEITQRKRVEAELQQTMTRIIDVQEEERKRLSRDLHDGIGQNLYSHLITISRLSSEVTHPLIDQLRDEATALIEEVREISWELRPSVLDDLGLLPAIRSFLNRYSEHYDIDVYFECVLGHRLRDQVEITIYRIIQEALTNIRKYARVNEASVTIRELDDGIRVMIQDKGEGFDMQSLPTGVGLVSMEERAKSVGGNLEIHSQPGEGTKIILEIPN